MSPSLVTVLAVLAVVATSRSRASAARLRSRSLATTPTGSWSANGARVRSLSSIGTTPRVGWPRHAAMSSARRRWRPAGRGQADLDHAVVLESLARSLRSGQSLGSAVEETVAALPRSPAARDLAGVAATVRAGGALADALDHWTDLDPSRGRVLAGTALVLAAELGGAPARSLDDAASGLRDRAALAREVRALSSQARASAAVMVVAPPVFLAAASMLDRRLPDVLFRSPFGLACLAFGTVLDSAGACWMARLVGRVA